MATYTTPGTYADTVPAGCTQMIIECWGGGGAGAGLPTNTVGHRGGGAGGQYSKKTINTPVAGQNISITVAAARSGTTGNASNGNDSFVSVNSVEQCRAKGGASAVDGSAGNGSTSGGVGDTIRAGGNGAAGGANYSGGGGEGAATYSNGYNAYTNNGGTGTDGGDGGNGSYTDGVGGGNGSNYGGGGGGSNANSSIPVSFPGGNGASGKVVITFTIVASSKHHFIL